MSTSNIDVPVCEIDALAPGECREFQVVPGDDNAKILLSRTKDDGNYYATSHKCTHFGAPLASGSFVGNRVVCPWHCASFCVKTGDIEDSPALDALKTYPVRIDGSKVVVSVPNPFPAGFRRVPTLYTQDPESDSRTFVIVGGGAAGAAAVQTLREDGFRGRIKLISGENYLPYDRIHLSKTLRTDPAVLRDAAFYSTAGIEVSLSTRVVAVDVAGKTVTTDAGVLVGYDKLLVATGCLPRKLTVPGGDLPNVFTIRTVEDAQQIVSALSGVSNVVVVGTSFIGVESAAGIRGKNDAISVTLVGIESAPFERVLGLELGSSLQKWCEEKGLSFRLNATVTRIVEEGGKAVGVELGSGEVLPAQLVLAGVGAVPTTPFSAGVEIGRDGGITCDNTFKAAEDVYVAGDIARFPLWSADGALSRIEHWCVAEQQGKIAAKNMNGNPTPYRDVPFFWTNVCGKAVRVVGYGFGYDGIIVDGDISALKAVVYYTKAGKVISAATIQSDPAAAALFNLFKDGVTLTAEAVQASLGGPQPIWKSLTSSH